MGPWHRTRTTGVLGNVARTLGAASLWVWAWVLPIAIAAAAAAIADARAVDSIVNADARARERGDHVLVVSTPATIDARSCDALAASSGAWAAGAWRDTGTVRLAVLPDDAISMIEITPGLIPLVGATAEPPTRVLVGAGLAERLGSARRHRVVADSPAWAMVTTGATMSRRPTTSVIEIDGPATTTTVLPQLNRSFLAVDAPTGTFDSCAIAYDRLTERDVETALVALTGTSAVNLTVGTASGIPIDRIADPNVELRERSTSRLALTTAALGFLVGAFVSFFRRKELIVLSICGWSRLARVLQTTVECAVLSVVPVAATVIAARLAVPELASGTVAAIALRTGVLAVGAATLGSLLPVAAHRSRTTLAAMRE